MIEFMGELNQLIKNGYIEYKRNWLGKKKYSITPKGKDYFRDKMSEQIRYIQ